MDVFTRTRIRQARVRQNPSHASDILANQIQLLIVAHLMEHLVMELRNQSQTRPDYSDTVSKFQLAFSLVGLTNIQSEAKSRVIV